MTPYVEPGASWRGFWGIAGAKLIPEVRDDWDDTVVVTSPFSLTGGDGPGVLHHRGPSRRPRDGSR